MVQYISWGVRPTESISFFASISGFKKNISMGLRKRFSIHQVTDPSSPSKNVSACHPIPFLLSWTKEWIRKNGKGTRVKREIVSLHLPHEARLFPLRGLNFRDSAAVSFLHWRAPPKGYEFWASSATSHREEYPRNPADLNANPGEMLPLLNH